MEWKSELSPYRPMVQKTQIIPQNLFLIIESGLVDEHGVARFPYLLKHENGEFDCNLSKLCAEGALASVPENYIEEGFRHCYRQVEKLNHLSSETILFIGPGERFYEDMTFKLKPGVYRATCVWKSVKEDCVCGIRQFIIREE